jgi:hypothetical protein
VFNLLEDETRTLVVVNPHHIKAVPGRKTDVKDSEWIADLLRHGLAQPSFIPPASIRELRELTRRRKALVQRRSFKGARSTAHPRGQSAPKRAGRSQHPAGIRRDEHAGQERARHVGGVASWRAGCGDRS